MAINTSFGTILSHRMVSTHLFIDVGIVHGPQSGSIGNGGVLDVKNHNFMAKMMIFGGFRPHLWP